MKKYILIITTLFIIISPFIFGYSKIVSLDTVVNDPEYVNCERVTKNWSPWVMKENPCPTSEVRIVTKHYYFMILWYRNWHVLSTHEYIPVNHDWVLSDEIHSFIPFRYFSK